MKLFIDTANVDHIREASTWGVIAGVTTNPSLIAKEGRKLVDVIKEIVALIPGPISAEVQEGKAEDMVQEALTYARIHPNIVIKLPMTMEGVKATKVLSDFKIATNVTLVFSVSQALIAARAGATYVSPFMGRVDDRYPDQVNPGQKLVADIAQVFAIYDLPTEIIAASIRHTGHIEQAALAGADIATIPFKVLQEMTQHELTDKGLAIFREASKAK